jgi:manganese efflux pump family protein
VLALLLLAVALGLSNFAAAIGIGVSGVRGPAMVRIAVVFGVFEAGMPVLGLALGHGLAAGLGQAAHWLGGAVLIAVGVISLIAARQDAAPGRARAGGRPSRTGAGGRPSRTGAGGRPSRTRAGERPWRTGRVAASGLALSADNLAVGFALGAYHIGLAAAALIFGTVSVAMSLAGLELGAKIGATAGDRSEAVASVLLMAVGVAIATGVL